MRKNRAVPIRTAEDGFVLISAIIAISLVLLTLLAAATFTDLGSRVMTLQLTSQGQALNTAQAGLTEGLDWFRRQTQPVTAFAPTASDRDAGWPSSPASIQRDYLISAPGNVWGHYELFVGNAATGTGVLDLTQNRLGTNGGSGVIWQLESTGVVYVRNDSNLATHYNQAPNVVLATKTLRAEIQQVSVNLPTQAALMIQNSGRASIGTSGAGKARVVGGTTGVGLASASNNSPYINSAATLSGSPSGESLNSLTSGQFSIASVFPGISSLSNLASIADISVTSVTQLPASLPPMQIIVISAGGPGNAVTFNSSNPLVGSGILVVDGDLTVDGSGGVPSSFNGIIYVTGNVTITGPSTISGAVIAAGASSNATVNGVGDYGEIYFDPFILSQVRQQLGQFRFSRPGYVPCPTWDTNCNSRFASS